MFTPVTYTTQSARDFLVGANANVRVYLLFLLGAILTNYFAQIVVASDDSMIHIAMLILYGIHRLGVVHEYILSFAFGLPIQLLFASPINPAAITYSGLVTGLFAYNLLCVPEVFNEITILVHYSSIILFGGGIIWLNNFDWGIVTTVVLVALVYFVQLRSKYAYLRILSSDNVAIRTTISYSKQYGGDVFFTLCLIFSMTLSRRSLCSALRAL